MTADGEEPADVPRAVCGSTDTATGEPCQRPMGWGTDSDLGPCRDHRGPGRPSSFTRADARTVLAAARAGKSKAGCARAAGIGEATLARWLDADPPMGNGEGFHTAFRKARAEAEALLVRGPLERPDEVDGQMARFLLATSFGYRKTERTEHTGADGGPIRTEATDEERDRLNAALDVEPET